MRQQGQVGKFVGKVAIITGSSRGIGRACAEQLATEGARVVLNATVQLEDVLADFAGAGHDALAIRGDVTDAGTIEKLVAAARDTWGRLDLIVNNVGTAGEFRPVCALPRDQWCRTIMTNTWPALHLVREAIETAPANSPPDAVVNISSVASRLELPGRAAYNASKQALESLTRALARELGPAGVRVNAVAPGIIRTEMGKGFSEGPTGERRTRHMPLRRLGDPVDVAKAVAYLRSGDASYITGVVLDVDGGYLLAGSQAD